MLVLTQLEWDLGNYKESPEPMCEDAKQLNTCLLWILKNIPRTPKNGPLNDQEMRKINCICSPIVSCPMEMSFLINTNIPSALKIFDN